MELQTETMPETILAKHPEFAAIAEAIAAHRDQRQITARCRTCDAQLSVTDNTELGSLWVTCETGCTSFHLRYEAHTKAA